jgi:hypothetical protein
MDLLAASAFSVGFASVIIIGILVVLLLIMIKKWWDACDKGYRKGYYEGCQNKEDTISYIRSDLGVVSEKDENKEGTSKILKSRKSPSNL